VSYSFDTAALGPLIPFLILAAGGLFVLLADSLAEKGRPLPWMLISAPVPVIAFIVQLARWPLGSVSSSGGMLVGDSFGAFVTALVCLSTFFAIVLSEDYLRKAGRYRGDYFALLLFSASGMVLFSSTRELLMLFLGLELLSIPVYILSGFLRKDPRSVEASLKYFLLGAFSSAIFLFGGALIYAASGTTDLGVALAQPAGGWLPQAGALLLLIGFLFKVAAVPFHMWTPDVYEGAPTAVTAFMASGVKAAAFGALCRVLFLLQPSAAGTGLAGLLWWVAVVTMTVGNAAALTQTNIKRMLAYSSIAHAGYMLIGLAVFTGTGDAQALSGILYYLAAYVLSNIGAFAVVILWAEKGEERLEISEWAGLGWRSPAAALALSVFMISLSGIPPTAGFFGKYAIFRNAIEHGYGGLVIAAVLNSALSVYYYLRVLVALYMRSAPRPLVLRRSVLIGAVAALCAVGTLWIGFAPDAVLPGVPALFGLVRGTVVTLH
jgi:NADH-quinone oxidoreductase subunit N